MALTPMMQQYLETKEQYKDCILFFRIGDFYEMFFEDAEIASKELELVLTGKDCGLNERAPMCGIPYHAAESYIAKLIENGHKVAICEQVEDPALAKGIVKREVIRTITPGTVIETNLLNDKQNNYIGCLYVDELKFAISICDISTGEFLVTSSSDSSFKAIDELSKYNPSELLVIENNYVNTSKFIKSINSKFHLLLTVVKYDKQYKELLNDKFGEDISEYNEYEMMVASCLYNYLNDTQKGSLAHITKISKYNIKDFMVIDSSTRRNLELTETIRTKSKKGSLLWVLDYTETSMGGRLLRKWIEEPLVNKDEINKRLDAVDELLNNLYISSDLREFLKSIYDIERIISKISYGAANARDLISLKESLKHLPDVKASLSKCKSKLLRDIYEDFDVLDDVYELIDKSIKEDPSMQLKEGGIIKEGYNSEVDRLRDAMHNGKQWIAELEQKERDLTGIKSLKIGYNKVFGYYIDITKSNLSNVPEDRYIRKQTLSNSERYITSELKDMEDLILNSESKVVELEYNIFIQIREQISKEVVRIQKTAYYISVIDVLLSFAKVSYENNYVKPKIIDNGCISIKDGRHPVVEKMIQGIFVPNDTCLDLKDNMILIITGPNMAGKSTYMRQVALITLMAHIGCFVPAKEAEICITDRIFTRIGASDDLSLGQSTFMVEMMEVSYILKNATKNSLILLDEVGRGTSTFDGLSIAWAVVDYISSKIKAKTLFATHYHELTELEGKYPQIKNYCISVKEHGDDIIFLRKIVRGGADKSYGIQVAKLAGLPDEVIDKSKEILLKLEELDITKNLKEDDALKETAISSTKEKKNAQMSFFDFKGNEILESLKNIDVLNLTPMEALNLLYDISQKVQKL